MIGDFQMQLPGSFWHADVGNLVTWVFICIAWIITRAMDWRSLKDRQEQMQSWQEKHQGEADVRDTSIQKVDIAIERLTTLQASTDRRITMLEELILPQWRRDIARNLGGGA